MQKLPVKLEKKLEYRRQGNAFRSIEATGNLIDFSSNDYLGFAASEEIFKAANEILIENKLLKNGSGGSRLLSGNHQLYDKTEIFLAEFHQAEAALMFNSGYDANTGFFASVPQRGDIIFYDELIHASIRDGIQMGLAKAYKFKHNDFEDLKKKALSGSSKGGERSRREIYVATESVFSMDGDSPNLKALADFCSKNNFNLIVDEAHATGVFGEKGEGLVQELGIVKQVFARINTFGKAIGCHGAVILGGEGLKNYLINFCRSLIYTTALPPHAVATIFAAYRFLNENNKAGKEKLHHNIHFFKAEIEKNNLQEKFIDSNSAIQTCIFSGNENVKNISKELKKEGFEVKPILSPTVPGGKERLRFCLHSFNSEEEIKEVLKVLGNSREGGNPLAKI